MTAAEQTISELIAVVKDPAKSLALVAFFDILVFFGVLLVGFAYLWKRGDLDWVRSTAAEQAAASGAPPPVTYPPSSVLTGAGQGS